MGGNIISHFDICAQTHKQVFAECNIQLFWELKVIYTSLNTTQQLLVNVWVCWEADITSFRVQSGAWKVDTVAMVGKLQASLAYLNCAFTYTHTHVHRRKYTYYSSV